MSFSDLEAPFQEMFLQPDDFELWAERLDRQVVPWVKRMKNKGLWEAVRFVSILHGVLREKLSRRQFAELVVRVCPSMRGEKPSALAASMQKGGGNVGPADEANYATLPEGKWLKKYGSIIEKLLQEAGDDGRADGAEPMAGEVMLKAVRHHVETTQRTPLCRLRERGCYESADGYQIQPSLCLETYTTDEFMQAGRYSQLLAFECTEEEVAWERFAALRYQYQHFDGCKLVIVSTKAFAKDVIKEADRCRVALCRMNRHGDLTFILPRTLNDGSQALRYTRALLGGEMAKGLFLYDRARYLSLAEWLREQGVAVAPELLVPVPRLSYQDIQREAEAVSRTLLRDGYAVTGFGELLRREGLTLQWGELPAGQLGRLDLAARVITLSWELCDQPHRLRFTLAHELGHYFLHARPLGRFFTAYAEDDNSLAYQLEDSANTRWLEYQANMFAACLLMPALQVAVLACLLFTERERNMGYIWYDGQHMNAARCHHVIAVMAQQMQVSRQAMHYRMKRLRLLREDERHSQSLQRVWPLRRLG